MIETPGRNQGLESGHQWTAVTQQDQLLEWSMDTSGEFTQGPLEMGFFKGNKIGLNLEPGQLALLATGSQLRAVFLDGGHVLDIGTRSGQIQPESRLIFLAIDRPLDLRWTFGSPIDLPGPGKRHIIGNCQLNISEPSRFFDTFLEKTAASDSDSVTENIEKVTRQTLTEFLASACSEGPGFQACLQTTLMSLKAESLTEDLLGFGLTCSHLALYTAQPPVEDGAEATEHEETAGHSRHLAHN